jgi:hypothetical protein
VPGWADQTGDEEQPLYHPLGLQESPVHQLTHLEQRCQAGLTRWGTRTSLSTILWSLEKLPFTRTINYLTHLEAEVPGWAHHMGEEEQPLYQPLDLLESPVYQNQVPGWADQTGDEEQPLYQPLDLLESTRKSESQTLLTLRQRCQAGLTRRGTRNSLSIILWASRSPPYISTTNLTHLEAEVPGWADQTGDEEQPLYHPLGLHESSIHQKRKPYSP